MSESINYQPILQQAGLKVTPQRIAVLDAIYKLEKHPTSEDISNYVRNHHPNIALGTVYNILELYQQKGIVSRVKTDRGAMIYDTVSEKHHHLYSNESDRIEDYYDEELDELLEDYFRNKRIRGFEVDDIKLQLVGRFKQNKPQS
jgi:Fur family peroxide stress response transcriptional regulator